MPNNYYGPRDSVIEGQRNRSRRLMANALLQTPGVGEGFNAAPVAPEAAASSQALYRQGLDAYLGQNPESAMGVWEQAVQMNPGNLEARRGLERLRMRQVQVAASPSPASQEGYRQGLAALLSGDDMGAAGSWQSAYSADPQNLDARRGLQRMLMMLTKDRQ